MSNNKNKKRVYSKPVVEKPVEKIKKQVEKVIETKPIESIDPEVTEARPIDPEVFETKLFVEEEPEELTVEEINEELRERHQNFDAEAELEKALHEEMNTKELGVDTTTELQKNLEQAGLQFDETPEPEKKVELVKGDELTEKLKKLQTKIEDFKTIQVVPSSPEPESELMYTLTPEQEEEGAKAVADMVDAQIFAELKALAPKNKIEGEYFLTEKQADDEKRSISSKLLKDKILDSLSQHDLRHFRRTGQMPKNKN